MMSAAQKKNLDQSIEIVNDYNSDSEPESDEQNKQPMREG